MRKSTWLLSAGLFALSVPANAQDASVDQNVEPTMGATADAAAVDDTAIERQRVDTGDIVVTATRRNQALSDVPLAVSAVTAETMEYSGANDIRQLTQVAPSLMVSSTSSESAAAVARIRGIGTVGDNPGLESSVALFVDGVYRSRTALGLTELGALDRVEVLRGPQGTLFGRNASAGLISIITARPRFENQFTGQLDIGNYDMRRIEGSATGAISSDFAARIDGVYHTREGFLRDVISGRDVNDRDRWMVRAQGLYQPTDNLAVRIIGDMTQRREECCAAPYLPAQDTVRVGNAVTTQPSSFAPILRGLGAVINDNPYERRVSITPGRDFDSDVNDWGVSGEVVYDLGGPELTSITAYRHNNIVRGQDPDFNNLDIWFRQSGGGFEQRFKTFTQEVRLQGETMAGRLDWLVGGFYSNENLRTLDNLTYGADYGRYANCLVAFSLAGATNQPGLVMPTNATCFNPAVAGAVLPFLPAAQQPVLSAFARLGPFAGAPFTNSGFTNLALASGGGALTLPGSDLDDRWEQTSNNWAVFSHNIFEIAQDLNLTLGARYTTDRKRLDGDLQGSNPTCTFFAAAIPALQTIPCISPSAPGGLSLTDTMTESRLSGTAVVSYKPMRELLTYASYSRGYKGGGFNLDRSALRRSNGNGAVCVTPNQPGCGGIAADAARDLRFRPEINDAFELGMKYNGLGIDVNVAVFHQLFRDFQLNTFNGLNFVVENINSCSQDLGGADRDNDPATGACPGDLRAGVRSMGAEIEVFTRPLPNVNLNLGLIYADTSYRPNLVGTDGRPLTNALFLIPGRRLSNSSEWVATTQFAWTPPIGGSGMRGLVYFDARLMSEFNTGSDLFPEKRQGGFIVSNGRIGLHGPDRMWGVELWGQNLFNEQFLQVAFNAPPAQGSGTAGGVQRGFYPRASQLFGAFLGEPRTFGVTLRGRF